MKNKRVKQILFCIFLVSSLCFTACSGETKKEGELTQEDTKKENQKEVTQPQIQEMEDSSDPEAEAEILISDIMFGKMFSIKDYESYGYGFGGVIPVKKDGLWGAVNYKNEIIVPFEYSGYYSAPSEKGCFVFTNSTMEKQTTEFGDEKFEYEYEVVEYFLFDATGKILYQGNQEVVTSGDIYMTLDYENVDDGPIAHYYKLDGTLIEDIPSETVAASLNGYYNGVATVHKSSWETDFDHEVGEMDSDGNITWKPDPINEENENRLKKFEEEKARAEKENNNSNILVNSAGGFMGIPPLKFFNSINNGYYVGYYPASTDGYLYIFSEEKGLVNEFVLSKTIPDEEKGFVVDSESLSYNEEYGYRYFFHDGDRYYNYGPHMVFILGDQDVLVDFTKAEGMNPENMSNTIVSACYDRIYMADSVNWRAYDEEKMFYIDHGGSVLAEFEDATDFYQGYAAVIKEGRAYLIDETFAEIQDLGEAKNVDRNGEIIILETENDKFVYGRNQ